MSPRATLPQVLKARPCAQCGQYFTPTQRNDAKYCAQLCWKRARRAAQRPPAIGLSTSLCVQCGALVARKSPALYCAHACQMAAYRVRKGQPVKPRENGQAENGRGPLPERPPEGRVCVDCGLPHTRSGRRCSKCWHRAHPSTPNRAPRKRGPKPKVTDAALDALAALPVVVAADAELVCLACSRRVEITLAQAQAVRHRTVRCTTCGSPAFVELERAA